MDKLIEELLKVLEDEVPENQIRILQELKNTNLEELYERIKTPDPKEVLLIQGAFQTLDLGVTNRRLTNDEMDTLRERIKSKDVYEKMRTSLMLCGELSDKLVPYMEEHPLVQEMRTLDSMEMLAEENRIDNALSAVILSMPTSKVLQLPTSTIATALDMILASICNAKNSRTYREQFSNVVFPMVNNSILSRNLIEALYTLYFYTLTKTRMMNNADRQLIGCYENASKLIARLDSSQEKKNYNQVAGKVSEAYEEYNKVLRKALAFKSLKLTI